MNKMAVTLNLNTQIHTPSGYAIIFIEICFY